MDDVDPIVPLTTAQAAMVLGLAPGTLHNMRCTGGGPKFYKIGRVVRYDLRDLEAWKAERRVGSTSETLKAA
jgi:hypothetical protein